MVAAVLGSELRLRVAPHGADDGRSELLRPLAEDETDPARCRVHEHLVAELDGIRAMQEVFRRHSLQHHGGARVVVDPVRQSNDSISRHVTNFGVRTERRRSIRNPATDLDARHPGAHGFHHARPFHADRERK